MHNWELHKVGDISESCLGKMLDKEKNKGAFHPYLSNKCVRWGGFNFDFLSKMRFEKHEHERFGLEYGDIVVCEGGEPGRSAIWKNEIPNMKIQKALHRIRVKTGYSNEFLYYRFLLAGRTGDLEKYFIGSTIKHLTGVNLKRIKFTFPTFKEQKQIAKVLSSLDSKIELNNRINAELEGMAKLIYDYWFVQFDFPISKEYAEKIGNPTLAGKPYKSSGGKMVYNGELKREIPEGWEVRKIGNVLKTELGGTPETKINEYWKGEIPWLNSGEIANFPIIDAEERISLEAVKNSATSIMPVGTCVLSITRHLRPSILAIEACANQSVVGIYESEKIKAPYVYPYLKSQISRLMSLRSGAQQPHINKGTVDESLIIIPSDKVLDKYYQIVEPLYNKIINSAFESGKISSLRDWLLPMLMNGQVKVADESGEMGMAADGEREEYNATRKT